MLLSDVLGLSAEQLANATGQITSIPNPGIIPDNPACNSGQQFDVFSAILSSLQNLHITLAVQSTVHMDEFQVGTRFTCSAHFADDVRQTDLDFNQYNVPVQVSCFASSGIFVIQLEIRSTSLLFTSSEPLEKLWSR